MARKFQSSETPTTDTAPTDDEPFTDANYLDRARAHVKAHGGNWLVIRNEHAADKGPRTSAQWLAWMDWFASHGMPTAFKEKHGVVTVPAMWPEDFDFKARASDREVVIGRDRVADWGDRPKEAAPRVDEPSLYDEAELERRKAFITDFRAKHALREIEARGSSGSLLELDARKCQGELRDRVIAAQEAHLAKLREESAETPLTLSPAALASVRAKALAGASRFDDSLD